MTFWYSFISPLYLAQACVRQWALALLLIVGKALIYFAEVLMKLEDI
jgi:hypothetical protein